jgi:hypothetical protein
MVLNQTAKSSAHNRVVVGNKNSLHDIDFSKCVMFNA